jgi:hypothetical protein
MRELTYQEAEERAQEYATPISDLIGPEEVYQDADKWEDVPTDKLQTEISQSIDIIMGELSWHNSLKSVMYERAITCHKENMMRAPMEHLTFETKQEAVANGYWPYKMTHGEVMVSLQETYPTIEDIPSEDYQEAYQNVSSGLYKGMHPHKGDN